jgi:alkyl hydroperoxide reductase subunit AhpF
MNSPMSVNTREMGEKMVAAMGDNPVVMLKAHGVVAAGDVTTVPFKQIVISMGEGSKAALSAFDYLIRH